MAKKILKKKTVRQGNEAKEKASMPELERIEKTVELKKSKPSRFGLLFLAAVILVIALGGIAAFIYLQQQDNLSSQVTGLNPGAVQGTGIEPELELIVLSSNDCLTCDTNDVITAMKTLFPTTKVREVDLNSEEGMKLKQDFKPVALPAFIYPADIIKAKNYIKLQPFLLPLGGSYLIKPVSTEASYFFEKPVIASGSHSKGNPDAKVTVVEFSDFQCAYCKKFFDETYRQLLDEYKDKIRFVFKHFPLDSHQGALPAAVASECAADQNSFWEYHDQLFDNQQEWLSVGAAAIYRFAGSVYLDVNKFKECYTGKIEEKKALIQKDIDLGKKFGVRGTPAFLVNNHYLDGAKPIEEFKRIIDFELQKAGVSQ